MSKLYTLYLAVEAGPSNVCLGVTNCHVTETSRLMFAIDLYFDQSPPPPHLDPYMECSYITIYLFISVCMKLVTFIPVQYYRVT